MLEYFQKLGSVSSIMRFRRYVVMTFLLLLLISGMTGDQLGAETVPPKLKTNAAIEVAIREAAEKPTGELTEVDLRKLTSLELHGITDLTALAETYEAEKLTLGGGEITDLKPITVLQDLESLSLSNNRISDLKP